MSLLFSSALIEDRNYDVNIITITPLFNQHVLRITFYIGDYYNTISLVVNIINRSIHIRDSYCCRKAKLLEEYKIDNYNWNLLLHTHLSRIINESKLIEELVIEDYYDCVDDINKVIQAEPPKLL